MKVLKNKRKNNMVHLDVETDIESMPSALDQAFNKIKKSVNIQGFRKGKVSRRIFEQHYGEEYLVQDAVNILVDNAYRFALEDCDLKVIDFPKNIDVDKYEKGRKLTFRCDVDVEPEVKLGKYKGVKVEKKSEEAEDDKVDEAVAKRTEDFASYEEADKAVEDSDIVQMNLRATIDGEEFAPWTRNNAGTRVGMANYGPDFDTEITGLKKDDTKTFDATLPADFMNQDIQGKTVSFELTILSVRKKVTPDLTDDFVKEKVDGFNTVQELRDKIKSDMDKEVKANSEQQLKADAIKVVVDAVKLEIPEVMVKTETDRQLRLFEQTLMQSGLNLKQYMDMTKKSLDDMRADLKEQSESTVKTQLVLSAITKKEKIDVSDSECEEEIKQWNHQTIKTLDDLKKDKYYDLESLKASISDRKTIDFILDNAKIK